MATIHLDKVIMPTGLPVFNAAKVSDAIALMCPAGETFDLGTLLVMLYLVDRRVTDLSGNTMTADEYYSFEGIGPLPRWVATIFHKRQVSEWFKVPIIQSSEVRFKVIAQVVKGALSEAERGIVEQVRDEYASLDSATLRRKVLEEAPEAQEHLERGFTFKNLLIALGEDASDAQNAFAEWESRRHLKFHRDSAA